MEAGSDAGFYALQSGYDKTLQMPLLVACALKKEVKALRSKLGDRHRYAVTGLGTDPTSRNLAKALCDLRPHVVLFTGMAGQLRESVQLSQICFPRRWRMESGIEFEIPEEMTAYLAEKGWDIRGTGLTVQAPVVKKEARDRLFQETGAEICDMESAAAMMVCAAHSIPCVAPKIVSDTADSGMLAFYRRFDENMLRLTEFLGPLASDLEGFPGES